MIKRTRKNKGRYSKIPVCERWQDFENFLDDMGDCPDGMSIDRIDNAKGYEPGNCRWATRKQQTDNRSTTIWLNGRVASDIAKENGISQSTFSERLRIGWSVERAATQKPRSYVNHGLRRRHPRQ